MNTLNKIRKYNKTMIKFNNECLTDEINIPKGNYPNYVYDTLDEISLFSLRTAFNSNDFSDVAQFLASSLGKIVERYIRVEKKDIEFVLGYLGDRIINSIMENENCNPRLVLNSLIEALSDIEGELTDD